MGRSKKPTKREKEQITKESFEIARSRRLLCGGSELKKKVREKEIAAIHARRLEIENLRKQRPAEKAIEFAAEVAAYKRLRKRK
jgi:hypothetical protein